LRAWSRLNWVEVRVLLGTLVKAPRKWGLYIPAGRPRAPVVGVSARRVHDEQRGAGEADERAADVVVLGRKLSKAMPHSSEPTMKTPP
jgi:hypothetical protein